MDWLVYWFMLPACILIAGTATFSGISGAALMTPVFLIGFPLMGVPPLGTVAAIGAALFLETSGFGTGVYHYARMRLADLQTARSLIVVTVPLTVAGAVLAHLAPVTLLRLVYGVAMLGVAWLLFRGNGPDGRRVRCPCVVCESECSTDDCPEGERREIRATDGTTYRWCPSHLGAQRAFSGVGALLTGLISTGVGEATLPTLVRRSRFPVPVAARRPPSSSPSRCSRPRLPISCSSPEKAASLRSRGTSSLGVCPARSSARPSERTSRAV